MDKFKPDQLVYLTARDSERGANHRITKHFLEQIPVRINKEDGYGAVNIYLYDGSTWWVSERELSFAKPKKVKFIKSWRIG